MKEADRTKPSRDILLDCPFCGADMPELNQNGSTDVPKKWTAFCEVCGGSTRWCDTEWEATEGEELRSEIRQLIKTKTPKVMTHRFLPAQE